VALVAGWLTTGTADLVARALFVIGFAVFAWLSCSRALTGSGA
jgi:hypothetical protein